MCGKFITSKDGKKFCSVRCSAIHAGAIGASKVRKVYPQVPCERCGGEFEKRDKRRRFCSHSCAANVSNRSRSKTPCLNGCGKHTGANAKKFCSRKCWHEFKREKTISRWKSGEISGAMTNVEDKISLPVRRHVLENYDYRCAICGWGEVNPYTGKVPVQVHHKDGSPRNHGEENLIVLCPNCHSLTETYGALNKGRGRKKRHLVFAGVAEG